MSEQNLKKNMIWNAAGNLIYMACQWIVTVLVTNLGDFYNAGVLSIAMSVSATFRTLAMFGIRNYQVSDVDNKYSDTCYVFFRLLSCAAALLFCMGFSLFAAYRGQTLLAILLFMLFRLRRASRNFQEQTRHKSQQSHSQREYTQQSYSQPKSEGDVKVHATTQQPQKRVNDNVGDYVEFEEVKEQK
jgi:ABC-type transport system involved in cytochrome bd biosynthesis fused ATPase/permease subunit